VTRDYQTLCPAGHRGHARLATSPVAGCAGCGAAVAEGSGTELLARCPDCGMPARCYLLPLLARLVR